MISRLLHLMIASGLMIGLSACVVKNNPAKTTVHTPAGTYEYHCPPGQRKKGHC